MKSRSKTTAPIAGQNSLLGAFLFVSGITIDSDIEMHE